VTEAAFAKLCSCAVPIYFSKCTANINTVMDNVTYNADQAGGASVCMDWCFHI